MQYAEGGGGAGAQLHRIFVHCLQEAQSNWMQEEEEEDFRCSMQEEEEEQELEHSYIEFSYVVCKKLTATGCKKKKKIFDAVWRRRSWSTCDISTSS
jgi:hypothetical protein